MNINLIKYELENKLAAVKLENFFDDTVLNLLTEYYLSHPDLKIEKSQGYIAWNGSKTLSLSGDHLSNSMGNTLAKHLSSILNREVLPSYSYARVYEKGSELLKHTDRDACELTLSINIYHDDNVSENLYMSNSLDDSSDYITIESRPGDIIIFNGSNDNGFVHWRDPIKSEKILQLFCHYVYKDGDKSHLAFEKKT